MCVGCGWCDAWCPKKISFSDTLNEFTRELEMHMMENNGGAGTAALSGAALGRYRHGAGRMLSD